MPATLQLAGASLIMVILLSLPIGFLCAVYKDGWFDRIMRGIVFMTTAMPAYWVGLLMMWLISIKLDLLPTSGNGTIRHLILPAFTVSLSYISTYIRLIRNNPQRKPRLWKNRTMCSTPTSAACRRNPFW